MKDLSLHILDIVQNSIRAKASLIEIEVDEVPGKDQFTISITDNGNGMSAEELKRAVDPFYTSRTTRKVGLGLSLFKQNAEQAGGSFHIESTPGIGTKVTAVFGFSHFDRPIMGDLVGCLLILICSPDNVNYIFRHKTTSGEYVLDTREMKETLGEVPIDHPDVRAFLKEMIAENLEQIHISE
ncbi:MAG TPA: ATP-binding protein [Prolixibacteraceae bacterium]|nr:ATP-binding protein [Prolixibacteraceae bacterium]HPR84911.1 ATP-binding protein [Prolixibacteraceae bacterium]